MFKWFIDHHERLNISGFLIELKTKTVITIGDNRYNVYHGTGLKKYKNLLRIPAGFSRQN